MAEVKNAFIKSKMNKDLDSRLVPQGEYRDAVNIQVSKSEGDDVGALENVLGNSSIVNFTTIAGYDVDECIGYFVDEFNSTVYLFFTDEEDPRPLGQSTYNPSAKNCIFSYNIKQNISTKLVEGAFLNFSKDRPIIAVNLLENLLFFTDNRNQPRKINVDLANPQRLTTPTYYTTEDQISVAKYNPYKPIELIKEEVTGTGVVTLTTSNSTTATITSTTGNILFGASVSGAGVAANTTVVGFVPSTGVVTFNQANSISALEILSFTLAATQTTMQDVSSEFLPDGTTLNPYYNPDFSGDPQYLEDKFVRFSYRFKFVDGEYSILAPFTQIAFIPKQDGYFIEGDEQQTFATTIVEFMENKVTQIALQIPMPEKPDGTVATVGEINSLFKITELDIIYKESNELAVQIVDTIQVDTLSGTDTVFEYNYLSTKPFKTLPSDEIIRVYDKIPVKAFGQEVISNRIVYSNFQNKHTPPSGIDYQVGVTEKLISSSTYGNAKSRIEYPNHTLKQNRNYQVGIILSDRYGRQSTTILSSNTNESSGTGFGADTVYLPYNASSDSITFAGDSLKVSFNSILTGVGFDKNESIGIPGLYNGNVSGPVSVGGTIDDVLGVSALGNSYQAGQVYQTSCYPFGVCEGGTGLTVRVTSVNPSGGIISAEVVNNGKDYNEGDIVNVVSSGGQTGIQGLLTIRKINSVYNPLGWYSYKIVVKQVEQEYYNVYTAGAMKGLPYDYNIGFPGQPGGSNNTSFITLINDNINKVPRDLTEVGPQDKSFRSSVRLFGRVNNTDNNFSNIGNEQYIPTNGRLSFTTNVIEDLFDLFDVLQFEQSPGSGVEPITSTDNPYHGFYKSDSNPFIAEFITTQTAADQFGVINSYSGNPNEFQDIENLAILETAPTVSRLDIFWETATSGLLSELNTAISESGGNTDATGIDAWNFTLDEADAPGTVIVNDFYFVNNLGAQITPSSATLESVFDQFGNDVTLKFTFTSGSTANTYDITTASGAYFYYDNPQGYTYTFTFRVNDSDPNITIQGQLGNIPPSVSNTSPINVTKGTQIIIPTINAVNGSNPSGGRSTDDITHTITAQSPAGIFTLTNNGTRVINTSAAAIGTGQFTLQTCDAGGACVSNTFTVNFTEPAVDSDFNINGGKTINDGDGVALWFANNTTSLTADVPNYLDGGSGINARYFLFGFQAPGSTNTILQRDVCQPNIQPTGNSGTFTNQTFSSGLTTGGTFYVWVEGINTNNLVAGSTSRASDRVPHLNTRYAIQYRANSNSTWETAVDISNTSLDASATTSTWDWDFNPGGTDRGLISTTSNYDPQTFAQGLHLIRRTPSTTGTYDPAYSGQVFAFNTNGEYRIILGNLSGGSLDVGRSIGQVPWSQFGFFSKTGTYELEQRFGCNNPTGVNTPLTTKTSKVYVHDFNAPESNIAPDYGTNPGVYRYQIANNSACDSTFISTGVNYYAAEPFAKYVTQLYTDVNLVNKATFTSQVIKRFRRMQLINTSSTDISNPEYTNQGAYTATFTTAGLRNGSVTRCLYT